MAEIGGKCIFPFIVISKFPSAGPAHRHGQSGKSQYDFANHCDE